LSFGQHKVKMRNKSDFSVVISEKKTRNKIIFL